MFLLNLLIDLYNAHSQAFTLQREPIRPLQAAAKLRSFQESPKQITDFLLVIPLHKHKVNLRLPAHNGYRKRYRNRKGRLSENEMKTFLICYHFGTYRNFKEYYQNYIRSYFHKEFPYAVSYNRFVELMPRVFFKMMLFILEFGIRLVCKQFELFAY
jgi:ISPg3, transposase